MKKKVIPIREFSPETLFPGEGSFELTIGGTTYEVSTHFDPDGRESVLGQFKRLLQKKQFS